jgi:hypothetical protein
MDMERNRSKYKIKKIRTIFLLLTVSALIVHETKGQEDSQPNEKIFVMGCLRNTFFDVDINDASAAIKVWGQKIENRLKLGVTFNFKLFEDINDLIKYPQKDNLGLVVLNSIDYLKNKPKLHVYPASVSKEYDEYLLLAKRDKYKNLAELKGKNLGLIISSYNPIPGMWIDVLLGRSRLNKKEKFFGSLKEFNKESQLILSVFFEQNDACIVSKKAFKTMCELNPQVESNLIILANSPSYMVGLACITKNSRKFSYIDKLIDATGELSSFPAGKQVLTLMKTTSVRRFKPGDLKTVEDLLKEYEILQK